MITKKNKYITGFCLLLLLPHAFAYTPDMDRDGVEDTQDLCPFYWQSSQVFMNVVGCQDKDLDGFEDMFWDACPGVYGRDQGCDTEEHYRLIAGVETPQITLYDSCLATTHTVQDGDILLLEVESNTSLKNAKPLYSYPIRVE